MNIGQAQEKPNRNTRLAGQIPKITGSLLPLFVLRTVVVLLLACSGVLSLYFGVTMLTAGMSAPQTQTVLFEINGITKLTMSGFASIVIIASMITFYLAYCARPMISLIPTKNGEFKILDANKQFGPPKILAKIQKMVGSEKKMPLVS